VNIVQAKLTRGHACLQCVADVLSSAVNDEANMVCSGNFVNKRDKVVLRAKQRGCLRLGPNEPICFLDTRVQINPLVGCRVLVQVSKLDLSTMLKYEQSESTTSSTLEHFERSSPQP